VPARSLYGQRLAAGHAASGSSRSCTGRTGGLTSAASAAISRKTVVAYLSNGHGHQATRGLLLEARSANRTASKVPNRRIGQFERPCVSRGTSHRPRDWRSGRVANCRIDSVIRTQQPPRASQCHTYGTRDSIISGYGRPLYLCERLSGRNTGFQS
jgi:hypothetical protein